MIFSVPTLFNIHQRAQTVCTLQNTRKKDVNLKNNFSVRPRQWGWVLKWLTLKIICCYNYNYIFFWGAEPPPHTPSASGF